MTVKAVRDADIKIGARLHEIRKAAGFSQESLGKAVSVTFQQIQKYEKGTNRISVSRLLELCTAIGCEPMDIISGAWNGTDGMSGPMVAAIDQRATLQNRIERAVNILKGRDDAG